MSGIRSVDLLVNGQTHTVQVEPRTLLTDALRHVLGLLGTHVGCEQGSCGACTVIIDGRAQRSCLVLAVQAEGTEIETIEGVSAGGTDHPIQLTMHTAHGLQCGFCTPGIVMSLVAAFRNGSTAEIAINEVLEGHICRCTGYVNIRAAITEAWSSLEGDS